jgi:hypothetical protein
VKLFLLLLALLAAPRAGGQRAGLRWPAPPCTTGNAATLTPRRPVRRGPADAARGACTKEVQAKSNFQVTYDPAASGDGKVCYRLSATRACNATSPCCLDASTALKSVVLQLPSELGAPPGGSDSMFDGARACARGTRPDQGAARAAPLPSPLPPQPRSPWRAPRGASW